MDPQRQQSDLQPDDLDRLLATARWSEPAPEVVGRLQNRWRGLAAQRRRRRRRWLAPAAVAAAILIAVGLTCFSNHPAVVGSGNYTSTAKNTTRKSHALENRPDGVRAKTKPAGLTDVKGEAAPEGTRRLVSRPANASELLILAAYQQEQAERRKATASSQESKNAAAMPTGLEQASAVPQLDERRQKFQAKLARLLSRGNLAAVNTFLDYVQDPQTASAAIQSLAQVSNPPVETLFRCLRGPRDRRMAAALTLGRLNRPEVSRELIVMAEQGRRRQEALIALLASSEPVARRFVADAAENDGLSAALWNAQLQYKRSFKTKTVERNLFRPEKNSS